MHGQKLAGILTSRLRDVALAIVRTAVRLLRDHVASRPASFRRGHGAAKSGARQVVLRVVLTYIRRHCVCQCPAITRKLRGNAAGHVAGNLARHYAVIALLSRGTPRGHRRAFGEP